MEAVALIAEAEGCRLRAYPCLAGRWTCGWGETDGVSATTAWTQAYADQRFCDSLGERVDAVRAACTTEPTENQLGALVSFAYNYGDWRTSTVLKCHNRGDHLGAARAFDLVNQYTDPVTKKRVVSTGLTARRKVEAAMYLRPADGHEVLGMPQAVAPQSSLASSPIVQSGGAVVVASGLSMVNAFKDQIGVVQSIAVSTKTIVVDTLGIPATALVPSVLIIAGCVVVWQRYKQRVAGWA
jgi:lysozyme